MNKCVSLVLFTLCFLFLIPITADAQFGRKKKKKKRRDQVEEVQQNFFLDKMWYGINIGNPAISNNYFALGLGPMAAYKITDRFSTGVITNFNYNYIWNRFGTNETYIDYSLGVFGRAKIFRAIYAHLEYNYTSLDNATTLEPRTNFPVMFVGAGYSSGRPPWNFEATLLFDVLGNLQTYQVPFVYRIGITYNF